ncbi:hypothetical protein Tco_1576950 [Tanacetum coccineum]
MTTLADKAILSGAENRPPMLENDMYDSWKSIMELYMMNRQHGRMILESVENGPLIWPSIEENGVYALVSNHKVAKELWERIQLLMQGTSLTKQERECKLYDEFDKFAYKKGETLLYHNVYSPSSSIPQLEYATSVNQQPEFSQPESGLIVLVFQKGDDPIDAINHMMSFLNAVGRQTSLAVGTTRTYTPRASGSNSGKQRTVIYNLDAYDSDFDELNTAKVALMVNLSHYGSDALAEVHNHDNVNNNMINQAVQAMPSSEHSNDVNHSETEITSDSNIISYSQYVIESQHAAV